MESLTVQTSGKTCEGESPLRKDETGGERGDKGTSATFHLLRGTRGGKNSDSGRGGDRIAGSGGTFLLGRPGTGGSLGRKTPGCRPIQTGPGTTGARKR